MMMTPPPSPLNKVARIEAILALIPAGRVVSYGQVADLAGLPGRARLVGKVLRETDKTLPWHRVLGAGGTISLPKGSAGFDEQIGRLQEEGVPVIKGRVRMREWQWQPDLGRAALSDPVLVPFWAISLIAGKGAQDVVATYLHRDGFIFPLQQYQQTLPVHFQHIGRSFPCQAGHAWPDFMYLHDNLPVLCCHPCSPLSIPKAPRKGPFSSWYER